MPQQPKGLNLNEYLTDDEIVGLIQKISRKIIQTFSGQVDAEDVPGWAGLGLVRAGTRFKLELLNADPAQATRQIRGWCLSKGFYETVDLMRHAKMVERSTGGTVKRTSIKAKEFSSYNSTDEDGRQVSLDPEDTRSPRPEDTLLARDIYEWARSRLRMTECDIVYYYYICRVPMYTVGVILNLSEARVSQMHTSILSRLRLAYQQGI